MMNSEGALQEETCNREAPTGKVKSKRDAPKGKPKKTLQNEALKREDASGGGLVKERL